MGPQRAPFLFLLKRTALQRRAIAARLLEYPQLRAKLVMHQSR